MNLGTGEGGFLSVLGSRGSTTVSSECLGERGCVMSVGEEGSDYWEVENMSGVSTELGTRRVGVLSVHGGGKNPGGSLECLARGRQSGGLESETVVSVGRGRGSGGWRLSLEETLWKNRLRSYLPQTSRGPLHPTGRCGGASACPLALALALVPGPLQQSDLIL